MTKEEKVSLVVRTFLEHPNLTILQLSELPELKGISSSSIQRYLNDPVIKQLFNEHIFNNIKEILALKNLEAKRKGGLTSFQNNTALKDDSGRFIGVKKASDSNNINNKIRDILIFAQIFLENPSFSLQDIIDFYNEINPNVEPVTRDYVYDCLSEHSKYEIFSEKMSSQISLQLEQRRYIGNRNGAIATYESRGKR